MTCPSRLTTCLVKDFGDRLAVAFDFRLMPQSFSHIMDEAAAPLRSAVVAIRYLPSVDPDSS